jgi:small GTP-binding protein
MIHKIFLFGLDRAGKTVITNYLTNKVVDKTFNPTLAPNQQLLVLKKLQSRIWDMPGQQKFRNMWVNYITGSELLVCVIDTADIARYDEIKKELDEVITKVHEKLNPVPPLLMLYHKMDLPESQSNIQNAKAKFNVQGQYRGESLQLETSVQKPESLEQIYPIIAQYFKE